PQVAHEALDGALDGQVLAVGGDLGLRGSPQVVHRVELRGSLRQPEQADVEPRREALGRVRRVAGILVEKQGDGTITVAAAQLAEKGLEVHRALALAAQLRIPLHSGTRSDRTRAPVPAAPGQDRSEATVAPIGAK